MSEKKRPGLFQGFLGLMKLALVVLFIRWIVFEIFVIPSGSMYPKLYVSDYIVVSKFDFGLRLPFTQKWLMGPKLPQRGAIVVFKEQEGSKFLIKRLVGLPGDQIKIIDDFVVSVNFQPVEHIKLNTKEHHELAERTGFPEDRFLAYKEKFPDSTEEHVILTSDHAREPSQLDEEERLSRTESFEVPEGHLLFLGDNRHQSFDGRRFGYIPEERLVGRSRYIVLSCDGKIAMNQGCNILKLRLDRLGNQIAF